MQNKAFQQCLADVYHGEIVGEVAFDNMLSQVSAPQEQYIVGSLLQYEAEAKAMMRPLLMRYGLAMHDANQGYATGQAASGQINQLPWAERFAALKETIVSDFLPRYEELATLVDPEEDPEASRIARFMGEHERALVQMADNVVQGRDNPAAPVVSLLKFPLPHPGHVWLRHSLEAAGN